MPQQPGYLQHQPGHSPDVVERHVSDGLPFHDLLPGILPTHPRLQFGRFYRSGRMLGIDYHDVLNLGGNRFAIVMADVSGPGACAAAAAIRDVVRARAGRDEDSASLIHYISEHFGYLRNDALRATALCAVMDVRRRTVRLSSAGHPAPLLARQGTPAMPLLVHSMMPLGQIGVVVGSQYELRSGDRLLFYTDGVTHRENADGARYPVDRLRSVLQQSQAFPPAVAIDQMVNDIDAFAGGHEADDDQTLLMVGLG